MNSSSNSSPLETIASYAIAFLAGAMTLALATTYGDWRAKKERTEQNKQK
jgi:hypothetical protein